MVFLNLLQGFRTFGDPTSHNRRSKKTPMRIPLAVPLFLLLAHQVTRAQDEGPPFPLNEDEHATLPVPAFVDTIPKPVMRRLMPDNLSFLERGLWGETGLLRGVGIASPLTPEVRKHELDVRRTMLTMHQIGGFATLGLMGATVYFGQRSLDHPDVRSYRNAHSNFVIASITTYSATALLSVLSPPPMIRRDESSTTTIHKTLAWVHAAGMILTPILGASIGRRMTNSQRARFHQISGYVTTATLAASMVVVTF